MSELEIDLHNIVTGDYSPRTQVTDGIPFSRYNA